MSIKGQTLRETNAPEELRCRSCGSHRIRRTHRIGLKDRLFSLAGQYPYHCHKCQARSMLAAKSPPERTPSGSTIHPTSRVPLEREKAESQRIQRRLLLFAICVVLFALFARFFILRA